MTGVRTRGHGPAARPALPFVLWALCLFAPASSAATASATSAAAQHPYILWTKEEAKALRERITSQPWAKRQFAQSIQKGTNLTARTTVDNLFLYAVCGDEAAGRAEIQSMLAFINTPPELKDSFDWKWHHIDYSDMAIKYDVLHDLLAPGQRSALEATFRRLAVFGIEKERLRGWESPRMNTHLLAALATGDRRLIKGIFECRGGVKDYLDGMKDGCFSPGGANPSLKMAGEMWLWCRAVERLGMDEVGFGYVGRNGGTMRKLIEGYLLLLDPPTDIPGGRPFYGRSALPHGSLEGSFISIPYPGDACFAGLVCRPLVMGRLPGRPGGWPFWFSQPAGAAWQEFSQGSFRMWPPLLFELAHRKWPDARFDFLLANMQVNEPDSGKYVPSVYSGLDPFDLAGVKPPPLKSAVYREMGAAILRTEEGEAYWTSPAPYAVLALTGADGARQYPAAALSLQTLQAFNRPIYRPIPGNAGVGAPNAAWFRSAKPYCTVVVDNAGPFAAQGEQLREHFDDLVKFVAARTGFRASPVPDVQGTNAPPLQAPDLEGERCLALTREYVFDAFRLAGEQPHTYDWIVNAPGSAEPDDPAAWRATTALDESLPGRQSSGMPYNYNDQRGFDAGGQAWSINAVQTAFDADPDKTVLGPGWYGRHVGVRVTMLGEPGTSAYYARKPMLRQLTEDETEELARIKDPFLLPARSEKYDRKDKEITEVEILPANPPPQKDEPPQKKPFKPVGRVTEKLTEAGGVTIVAERRAAGTTFVALHEPFQRREWKIGEFRRIQQTGDAVAVAVRGKDGSPVNDRILLRMGGRSAEPLTLADGEESFTFSGFGFVRIAQDKVIASGRLNALKVRVAGTPKLILNGEETKAAVRGGILSCEK